MLRSIFGFVALALSSVTPLYAENLPEVHLIGMYSAKPPTTPAYKKALKHFLSQCDGKHRICNWDKFRRKFPGRVTVTVTRRNAPLTLVLTAAERTVWTIKIEEGVRIANIVLSGYHAQQLTKSAALKNVPVMTTTYDKSPTSSWFYFYQNDSEIPIGESYWDGEKVTCDLESHPYTGGFTSYYTQTLEALRRLSLTPTSVQAAGEDITNSFEIGETLSTQPIPKVRQEGFCYRNADGSLSPA